MSSNESAAAPRRDWISRLGTFRQLRWQDRWLFLEASFLMSLLGASLRVLSLRRVQKILGAPGSGSPTGTPMKGVPYNAEPVDVSRAGVVKVCAGPPGPDLRITTAATAATATTSPAPIQISVLSPRRRLGPGRT